MANKTTQSGNDVVNYLARGVAPSWAGATNLYLSIHSAAVGLGGDQTTNEISYTGYSRPAIARNSSGGFNAASAMATANNALIQFGNATAGSFPITGAFLAIGVNPSGSGTVLATAALTSNITINLNSNPQIPIGNLVWQEQ